MAESEILSEQKDTESKCFDYIKSCIETMRRSYSPDRAYVKGLFNFSSEFNLLTEEEYQELWNFYISRIGGKAK